MLMFVKFHSQKNVRPTQGQICQNRLKILLLRLRNLLNELMLCRCRRTLPKNISQTLQRHNIALVSCRVLVY